MIVNDEDGLSFGDGANDSPFSLSFWVYALDASASSRAPISKSTDVDNGEYYVLIHTNDVYFRIVDESSGRLGVFTNNTISNDTWYHLVVTYDASASTGGMTIYQDAVAQTVSTDSSGAYVAMENTSKDFKVGLRNLFFSGFIDDVRVYSKALSSAEVLKIYEAGQ